MGLLQSIFFTVSFCLERVLTWTICALLIMLLMFALVVFMVYGIAAGYHYAQNEMSKFARDSRTSKPRSLIGYDDRPVVRLVAVNQSDVDLPKPQVEVLEARNPAERVVMDTPTKLPIVLLEPNRPNEKLTKQERDLALKLMGRMRRSRNATTSFFRMINTTESAIPLVTFI